MTQPPAEHDPAAYVPPAKYTRSGDGAQCCPHATPVGPGSCEYCWELHEAACEPCWTRRLGRLAQRIPLGELTSDQYDQLHAELDRLTAMAAQYADRAIENGKRAERYRAAWTSASARAQALSEGTLRHVADRDAWKVWTKKAEEAVKYWYDAAVERLERAKQAEAAIERVRAVSHELTTRGATWDGNEQEASRAILAALDEQQEQPARVEPEPVCNCTWAGLEIRRCPVHEPTA